MWARIAALQGVAPLVMSTGAMHVLILLDRMAAPYSSGGTLRRRQVPGGAPVRTVAAGVAGGKPGRRPHLAFAGRSHS